MRSSELIARAMRCRRSGMFCCEKFSREPMERQSAAASVKTPQLPESSCFGRSQSTTRGQQWIAHRSETSAPRRAATSSASHRRRFGIIEL